MLRILKTPILVIIALFVVSCQKERVEYKYKVKLSPLTEEQLFSQTALYSYRFEAEELDVDSLKNEAKKQFLSSIDLYKNKKKFSEAKQALIKSILTYPEAKSYYELSNLYFELKEYENSERALWLAKDLGYVPVSEIYFKQACLSYKSYLIKGEEYKKQDAIAYLRKMFNEGYVDTLKIKSSTYLSDLTGSEEYRFMLASLDTKYGHNSFFTSFTESFEDAGQSFSVSKENVELPNYESTISYDYSDFIPEMENVSFGRDVSHDFYYVAQLNLSPNFTTLIYKSKNYHNEDTPNYINLTNYDSEGKIIDNLLIACSCSAEKIKSAVIDHNHVTIEEHKRLWEKDLKDTYIGDNTVTEYVFLEKSEYEIADNGKIVKKTSNEESTTTAKGQ